MKRLLILLTLLLHLQFIGAQFPTAGEDRSGETGKLSFLFTSTGFFRNHEYFNPITEGYTLTGSHLRPLLAWTPVNALEIRGGLYMALWSGYEGGPEIKPVFSTTVHLSPNLKLTAGSLGGIDLHDMLDPHFRKDLFYTSFQEEGLQVLFTSNNISSDTWIDWERFTFHGDNGREEFTFGESFMLNTGKITGNLRMEFPTQLLIKHRGGQISNYTAPVETHMNIAAGTGIIAGDGSARGTSRLDITFFLYHTGKELPGIPFTSGNALWIRGGHRFRNLDASAGLWFSDNFYSPNGNMMFSSVSDYRPGTVITNRRLLTGSINYLRTWEADSFHCSLVLTGITMSGKRILTIPLPFV
jgi:hypothetical protein